MVTTEGDWRQDGFVIVRGLWAAERVEKLKEIADFCWGQWVSRAGWMLHPWHHHREHQRTCTA